MSDTLHPLRVSNDALDDGAELRARMADDGYVFIRRLFDPDAVLDLRREMLQVMQAGGWLAAGTDPMDGIADVSRQCTEGDPEYPQVYHEVYKLQAFHEAGHWPQILDVMGKIIDAPVLPHPQKIARLWFPKFTRHTTPVHQDFVHFQGSFDTYTCWAPVGDCPVELGGLAVAPGTHNVGAVVDHRFSLGAGQLQADAQDVPWLTTDYEPGDALLFHSLTLHKALPNLTEDRLRVSLDNRYQAADAPIAEHMLAPHLTQDAPGAITWDDVYADWTDDRLQYYWTERGGPVVPRDTSYSDRGFADALARAKRGDADARLHLERALRRDPDSDRGRQAAAALQADEAPSR